MAKKKRKVRPPEKCVFHDRFLTGERDEDNPYVTCALYFLVGLMSLLLILVVFVSMCTVSGTSMMNSYKDRDNILLYRFPTGFKHGDVVVFDTDFREKDERLIKRIIAVGGDELLFVRNREQNRTQDGHETVSLYRKRSDETQWNRLDESYILGAMTYDSCTSSINVTTGTGEAKAMPPKIAVAESINDAEGKKYIVDFGYMFVMGDNRNNSIDSRWIGAVPTDAVVGKEIFHFRRGSLLEKIMLLIFGAYSSSDSTTNVIKNYELKIMNYGFNISTIHS